MKASYRLYGFLYFCLSLILTGCAGTSHTLTAYPDITEAVSKTTPTATPVPSMTPVPKITVTSTATPLPATPTNAPTPTLPPPLSKEQAQKMAVDLLDNNAGCRLPCWWGITPGQTTQEQAREFFSQFPPLVDSIDFTDTSGNYWIDAHPPVPTEISPVGVIYIRVAIRGDAVYYLEIHPLGKIEHYRLARLLVTYGQPDEVWMLASRYPGPPSGGSGPGSFMLLYLYYRQGITARFGSPVERIDGTEALLRGCFFDGPDSLFLWPSQAYQSFLDFAKAVDLEELYEEKFLLPLDAATDMDVNAFYDIYSNTGNQPCLDTPEKLWPEP